MGYLTTLYYIFIFLFGIVSGSFLNVCILRIPKNESVVTVPSHCMSCGRPLKWYELFPVFSWLFLGGRCRTCKSRISAQYPLIEAGNGLLWVLVFAILGFTPYSLFCCLLTSALLALAVIDGRTGEIPFSINVFIFILGLGRLALNPGAWPQHVIGFFAVSLPLFLILLATGGRGIGGGDIKLMAACGFFLGWKLALFGFFAGCILGSVIHLVRIRFFGAGRSLALGPYLSAGLFLSMLFGEKLISLYMSAFLL